jgi:hypothetical protein
MISSTDHLADSDRINIDGDDEDVTKLNLFLIDPAGKAHHLLCERSSRARMPQQRSEAMITKRFVLAASMTVFIAMSGQAYAGTTMSDTRYWPSSAKQNTVQRSENAFDSNAFYSSEASRGIETTSPPYQGGPKGNY